MLRIHAERGDQARAQDRMSVDDIAALAYWQLICGEEDEELVRLRVYGLCAAVLGEYEACFPDARPFNARTAALAAFE